MLRDAHPVPTSPNTNEFFPSRNFNDGHTAGVGTASYAAPEQITENDYGPEVDIFALGIILLELFSNFTSEHERSKAFYKLRHGRELEPWMHRTYPEVTALVLACTEPDRRQRPTATDILNSGVFLQQNPSACTEFFQAKVSALKDEIDMQKDLLKEKDREIEELRQRLSQVQTRKSIESRGRVDNQVVDGEGDNCSSSDDDY